MKKWRKNLKRKSLQNLSDKGQESEAEGGIVSPQELGNNL